MRRKSIFKGHEEGNCLPRILIENKNIYIKILYIIFYQNQFCGHPVDQLVIFQFYHYQKVLAEKEFSVNAVYNS